MYDSIRNVRKLRTMQNNHIIDQTVLIDESYNNVWSNSNNLINKNLFHGQSVPVILKKLVCKIIKILVEYQFLLLGNVCDSEYSFSVILYAYKFEDLRYELRQHLKIQLQISHQECTLGWT